MAEGVGIQEQLYNQAIDRLYSFHKMQVSRGQAIEQTLETFKAKIDQAIVNAPLVHDGVGEYIPARLDTHGYNTTDNENIFGK